MAAETDIPGDSLKNWESLSSLVAEMRTDRSLSREFEYDPVKVLSEREIDFRLSSGEKLSTVLGRLSESERLATLEAVSAVTRGPDIGRIAAVTPVANANAGANANAVANANAAANANANANGYTAVVDDVVTLRVEDDFDRTVFAETMDRLHLNEFRRKALLKRAILSPENVLASKSIEDAEWRASRHEFRGVVFETEALIRGTDVTLLAVRVVA